MILMLNKSFEDLQAKADRELNKLGFTTSPGSIARLLLNVINTELGEFYEALTINHAQAFLSTAKDEFLDSIGLLLNCSRGPEEEDDDYRFRISKQILTTATSNETAVRLTALSVPGVEDIVLRKYSFGAGSFTVLITTDDPNNEEVLLGQVERAVNEVCGYGIKFVVEKPVTRKVRIQIKLMTKDSTPDGTSQDIKYLVRNSLRDYFTTMKIGDTIIINEITKRIMEVSQGVVSYTCEEFRINGALSMFINQECRWNERFTLSSEPDAILIM